MAQADADVVGVDWRVPLEVAAQRVRAVRPYGPVVLQGNLDPAVLLAPWESVEAKAARVLERAGARDGHIFNLGHGVLPTTSPETLQRLVDFVHMSTERNP
jgi:uroporphyrinogen decarboxylase